MPSAHLLVYCTFVLSFVNIVLYETIKILYFDITFNNNSVLMVLNIGFFFVFFLFDITLNNYFFLIV